MDETDPDLILANAPPEYFKAIPGVRHDYSKRTPGQIAGDVNHLFVLFRKQIKENDRLRYAALILSKQLKREKLWRKWLITLVASMWGLFIWLVKIAAPLIVKGLAAH